MTASTARPLLLLLAVLTLAPRAWAHGGEDHGPPPAAAVQAPGSRLVETQTDAFEGVLKFQAAEVKEPLPLRLFLTNFATNAPLTGATVKISIADLGLDVAATPSATVPGLYQATLSPGKAGTFPAVVSVTTPDTSDILLFDGLVFGPLEKPAGSAPRYGKVVRILAIGALACLVLAAFLLGRSSGRAVTAAVVAVALLAAGKAQAHGGEDHGGGAPRAGGPASVAAVTKEAQIAFSIRTIVVSELTLPSRRSWHGVVLARSGGKADVIAPQGGLVGALDGKVPQIGDAVRKGQPLLVLEGFLTPQEQISARSGADDAEAREAGARAELSVAEKQSQRVEALPEIVSQRERDEATARLATARAALAAAQRTRAVLSASASGGKSSATRYVLSAPIDGVVTSGTVTIGEAVEAGHRFFTVMDTSHLWVRVDAPEADANVLDLPAAAAAQVALPGSAPQPIAAHFVSVSRTVDPATRTVAAFFETEGATGSLLEGQLVDVLVETGASASGFLVPASAIVDVSGRPIVFVHVHAEEFAPRAVTLGSTSGDQVEVLSGLHEGDRVVVSGAFQVRSALLSGT